MTMNDDPGAPSHTVTTSALTQDEARVLRGDSDRWNLDQRLVIPFVLSSAVVGIAWNVGAWAAQDGGADAARRGGLIGAAIGIALVAGWLRRGMRATATRERSAQRTVIVEEIRVRAGRAVDWEGLTSSMTPAVCIDIGGGKLLLLLGIWMWDDAIYGASDGDARASNDEVGPAYVNRLPPPWSFPSTAFTIRRVCGTGRVLSIKVEGSYLTPDAAAFDLGAAGVERPPESAVLEGSLGDLGAAIRHAAPPLFERAEAAT